MHLKIGTHVNPDFDAIGFAWLLTRYHSHQEGVSYAFAPFFDPDVRYAFAPFSDPESLDDCDAVGDIGGVYDPDTLRFDHHQLQGDLATATCATKMVWDWMVRYGYDVKHLEPVIQAIHQGDLGKTAKLGMHAQLGGFKSGYVKRHGCLPSNSLILDYGFRILDALDEVLRKSAEAEEELAKSLVYQSDDGLVWGIQKASGGATRAAYERGARVVVWEGVPFLSSDSTSYPIGASRAPEWAEPNVGQLVSKIQEDWKVEKKVRQELASWYKHPAGFTALRGTPKSPDTKLIKVSLVEVAMAIDQAWQR